MIVAESGFGTGLNFLTLWQAFDVFVRDNPDVTLQGYISSVLKNIR